MLQVTTFTENEIIISEHYAVEVMQTARGFLAQVRDSASPFDGMYAQGSTRNCALAALAAKVTLRMQSEQ